MARGPGSALRGGSLARGRRRGGVPRAGRRSRRPREPAAGYRGRLLRRRSAGRGARAGGAGPGGRLPPAHAWRARGRRGQGRVRFLTPATVTLTSRLGRHTPRCVLRGMDQGALPRVPYLIARITCLRSSAWLTIRETRVLRVIC